MVQRIDVREGQRYAQRLTVRERASVWKVGAIVATGPKIRHARLINVADPLETKMISCFALRELMYYELIAETTAGTG
jgi:hypothetical protein